MKKYKNKKLNNEYPSQFEKNKVKKIFKAIILKILNRLSKFNKIDKKYKFQKFNILFKNIYFHKY